MKDADDWDYILNTVDATTGRRLKALPSDQANGRLDDRFCGKSMRTTILQAENVTDEVKCTNLAATISE